jgi:VanZ family protein
LPFLDVPGIDKLLHAGLFFVTGFFLGHLFQVREARPGGVWRRALMVLSVGVLFGAATEWAQMSVPGREASWLDLLANAVGSGTWWLLAARRGLLA